MCMIWGFRDAKKENGVIVVIVKYFLSTYLCGKGNMGGACCTIIILVFFVSYISYK